MAVLPGQRAALNLPDDAYAELLEHPSAVPDWFVDAAAQAWRLDLTGVTADEAMIVRPPSPTPVTYSRASYEINLGCNFACEHCYLEMRPFSAMPLDGKHRLIEMLADLGVLWF